jgi:hypothetical protein
MGLPAEAVKTDAGTDGVPAPVVPLHGPPPAVATALEQVADEVFAYFYDPRREAFPHDGRMPPADD